MMKKLVKTSGKLRNRVLFLLLCSCTSLWAQVENKADSLKLLPALSADSLQQQPTGFINQESLSSITQGVHPFHVNEVKDLENLPEMKMKPNLELRSNLIQWNGGALTGGHGEETIYGLGSYRTATALAIQQIGRFSLTGSLTFEKFNFYRNIGNGIGGQLQGSYYINRNISATAFGAIQTMGFFSPNTLTTYQYGGFFSFTTTNNKWGIDLGAQRYYNPITHQWTTQPIVMPYYKFQGQKLGVDFGGLLKSIFINAGESANPHTIKPMPKQSGLMPAPHHW